MSGEPTATTTTTPTDPRAVESTVCKESLRTQATDRLAVAIYALEAIACHCCMCSPEIAVDSEEKMCSACIAQETLRSLGRKPL